jgi:hypothetical protein
LRLGEANGVARVVAGGETTTVTPVLMAVGLTDMPGRVGWT